MRAPTTPEPRHTCGRIDDVKRELSEVNDSLSGIHTSIAGVLEHMEDLRSANKEIRAWGKEWEEYAEHLKLEVETAEAERDRIDSLLSDAKEEIRELERERDKLLERIEVLEHE